MSDFSDSDKNSPSIAISLKEATLFALSPMKLYKLWIVLKAFFQFSTKDNESHRDTCKKFKKSLTNLTNQYFISATFRTCSFISFSSFNDNKIRCKYYNKKKKRYKYYNKHIAARNNGNVQSHDEEESKLNSTIYADSGAHTLTHDKIIKRSIQ